ncbi:MAG: potassium channel family protein [Candidatus Methylomirabilales bacterium]
MKRFLVAGLGRFGTAVATALVEGGGEVIGVDHHMGHVEEVKDRIAHAVQLDSIDAKSLRSVGVADVDVAIVAMGEDFEAAVLTTAALKELGVKQIISRATTEREARILSAVGATRVLQLEAEMGQRLAKTLLATSVLDHIELSEGYSLIQWEVGDDLMGKTLADLELRSKHHVNVLAIKKRIKKEPPPPVEGEEEQVAEPVIEEKIEPVPRPDYRFEKGDIIILVGREEDLERLTSA